jgi:hypothetical protein
LNSAEDRIAQDEDARLEKIWEANSAIAEAISDANAERAIELIKALGESQTEVVRHTGFGAQGNALLDAAVSMELMDVVCALVEAGAELNVASESGSPAYKAALRGNIEMLRYLVERGADIDFICTNSACCSLLMGAIASDRTEVVMQLLDWGANWSDEIKSTIGYSAIEYAVSRRNVAVFMRLAELGAGSSDRLGGPLCLAIRRGSEVLTQECLKDPRLSSSFYASAATQQEIIDGCEWPAVREVLLAARSQQEVEASLGAGFEVQEPPRSRSALSL